MRVSAIFAGFFVTAALLTSAPAADGPSVQGGNPTAPTPAGPRAAAPDRLPVAFEENRGQVHADVLHRAHCRGYTAFLTADSAVLASGGDSLRMRFDGRAPAAEGGAAGYVNYLLGDDADAWLTRIPRHRAVRYRTHLTGASVVFRDDRGRLAFDWHLAAGVDARDVSMAFEGALGARIDDSGRLRLPAGRGEWVLSAPVAYQTVGDLRTSCEARFRLLGDGRVGFDVHGRDAARPLVIDPTVTYATYLGAQESEQFFSAAGTDDTGALFVAMSTNSDDFPVTVGSYQTEKGEDTTSTVRKDLCVTKLTPSGDDIAWATFLGGEADEEAYGGAFDAAGNAYLAGTAWSSDFPLVDPHFGTPGEATFTSFLAKLDATGTQLLYSTRIEQGRPFAVAVDPDARMYVAIGSDAPQVLKYSADGSELIYAYEMDVNVQQGFAATAFGLAADPDGNAYVVGEANNGVTGQAGTFPATDGAFQTEYAGGTHDAYVIKLDPDGVTEWATLIGGGGDDRARAVAVDAAGSVCVVGSTRSADFPVPESAEQGDLSGQQDAFVVKLHPDGGSMRWGTYLGGPDIEWAHDVKLHPCGTAHVCGQTSSATGFPLEGAFDDTLGGGQDAYLVQVDSSGAIEWGSYFGGSTASDSGVLVAVAPDGATFGVGVSSSDDFDTTTGAAQEDYARLSDAIIVAARSVFPENFEPLVILTSDAPAATVDAEYEFEIETTGGVGIEWTLLEGELPTGLSFTSDGVLSGTPTEVGQTTFALEALGTCGVGKFETTLVVHPRPTTGAALEPWTSGEPFAAVVTAQGGTPPFVARYVSGTVPPGLALAADGSLTGTLGASGDYTFRMEVEDRWGATAQGDVRLLVNPPVSIDTATLPPCTTARPYAPGVDGSGGTGALTWSLVDGDLPTTGTLDPDVATFGGNCADAGTYQFTVRAQDTVGARAERSLTVVVNPHPQIDTAEFPLVAAARGYAFTLTGSAGTPPYQWSPQASALPSGLLLAPTTGVLAGTTQAGGRHAVTILLVDSCGAETRSSYFIDVATRIDLSAKKPREELTFGSGTGLLARYVELLEGTTLSFKLRSRTKGLKELPLEVELLDPDGAEVDVSAFLRVKSKSVDLRKLPITRTGRYILRIRRTASFLGTLSLEVGAAAQKKWAGTASLDGAGTVVMLQIPVLPGTAVTLALKPAKKSAATPQIVSVTGADGADLLAVGKLKEKKKVSLKTTAAAGGVVTVVIANTSGAAGDVSWSAKLKAGKGYPLVLGD